MTPSIRLVEWQVQVFKHFIWFVKAFSHSNFFVYLHIFYYILQSHAFSIKLLIFCFVYSSGIRFISFLHIVLSSHNFFDAKPLLRGITYAVMHMNRISTTAQRLQMLLLISMSVTSLMHAILSTQVFCVYVRFVWLKPPDNCLRWLVIDILRGDCKSYPHNVNFRNIFSETNKHRTMKLYRGTFPLFMHKLCFFL